METLVTTESSASESRLERFSFTGNGKEYFGIWIVNILLTIITLGIYSAWAKVRNKQYFYGNTIVDGSSFEYTADPKQILKGRLIAFAAFVAYQITANFLPLIGIVLGLSLLILAPWIIMKSIAFNARYSQYRNIRFGFHQDIKESIKVFILVPMLMIVPIIIFVAVLTVFGGLSGDEINTDEFSPLMAVIPLLLMLSIFAVYPYIQYRTKRYIADNHLYGSSDFNLRLTGPKPFYGIYIKAFLIFIALTILPGIFFAMVAPSLVNTIPIDGTLNAAPTSPLASAAGIIMILITMAIYMFIFAYIAANTYNTIYQKTVVGPHKLRANMRSSSLAWLYITNTLGIIVTLGLFIPWAKVRSAKYRAKHTALRVHGDLDKFIANASADQNALGEEVGEMFDLEVGI